MDEKNKVISMMQRLERKKTKTPEVLKSAVGMSIRVDSASSLTNTEFKDVNLNKTGISQKINSTNVLDMVERRIDMLREDRREVRRTILSEFIGASVVVPEHGLCRVAIYDISDTGIAFDMGLEMGQFRVGEEVAMRVYLNHSTYFGFVLQVSNVRENLNEGTARFGAGFVKGSMNDEALFHFVKFIECVSASLHKDTGDVIVSGLRR